MTKRSKENALAWIRFAENDLAVAVHLSETFRPLPTGTICWLCQQSVEKSCKAILAFYDEKIPKTHDIGLLQQFVKKHICDVGLDDRVADKLTAFATESRYPDNTLELTNEDAALGLRSAKQMLSQARQALGISEDRLRCADMRTCE